MNLSAPEAVRSCKDLGNVEKALRCLNQVHLKFRPIVPRKADHVVAHIFLCVLAYYVEWHMRQKLAERLYADEELGASRKTRDIVLPAKASASARKKKRAHGNAQALPVHSFRPPIAALSTYNLNICCMTGDDESGPAAVTITPPTPLQQRAFELLGCTQEPLPITSRKPAMEERIIVLRG